MLELTAINYLESDVPAEMTLREWRRVRRVRASSRRRRALAGLLARRRPRRAD